MKSLVAALQESRRILGVCPCCGEIFRLTDLTISYRAKPRPTWLDALEAAEGRQESEEDAFEEEQPRIQELARERGRRELPGLLHTADSIFSCRGYFAQDVKPLFDPVDYVIFDGLNGAASVARVVLFDGPAQNSARERVQRSIRATVEAGDYDWRTVRIGKDGRIVSRPPTRATRKA